MTGFLLICVGLLLASALLSGSETGLYAMSRPRLRLRAATGDAAARRLERLLLSPAGVLGTLLLGNNLVNFGLTALVTATIAGWGWAHPEWWTTAAVSPFLLVFAEMTPKNVFRRRADGLMPVIAGPLAGLRFIMAPLVIPLLLFERLTGGRKTESVLSRERLRGLMFQGVEEGLLSRDQHELAAGVMQFAASPVGPLGIPWAQAVTAPSGADRDACIQIARQADRSRLPVVDADTGRVVGLLNVYDMVFQPETPVSGLVRDLPAFAASTPADEVMRRMGAERRHIALVGTAEAPEALVALEDLVDALVQGARTAGLPRQAAA